MIKDYTCISQRVYRQAFQPDPRTFTGLPRFLEHSLEYKNVFRLMSTLSKLFWFSINNGTIIFGRIFKNNKRSQQAFPLKFFFAYKSTMLKIDDYICASKDQYHAYIYLFKFNYAPLFFMDNPFCLTPHGILTFNDR